MRDYWRMWHELLDRKRLVEVSSQWQLQWEEAYTYSHIYLYIYFGLYQHPAQFRRARHEDISSCVYEPELEHPSAWPSLKFENVLLRSTNALTMTNLHQQKFSKISPTLT